MGDVLHDCQISWNSIFPRFNECLSQVPFFLSLNLGLSLIPSNIPGRTKRTVTFHLRSSGALSHFPLMFDVQRIHCSSALETCAGRRYSTQRMQ